MYGCQSMTSKELINRARELQSVGWNCRTDERNTIRPHSGHETIKHLHVKAEICRQAKAEGHTYWTEVAHGDASTDADYADVLIARESQKNGVVVEVETGLTKERKREKVNQYLTDYIQEVLVIDPTNAPDSLDGLSKWVENHLDGFV